MTITSTKKKIHLTVKPDSQAEGMTLDSLLAYLQFHDALEKDMVSKINIEAWEDYFRLEGLDLDRNDMYITVPIRISLLEGEYGITPMVRVFTTADFSIIGEGSGTVVRFHKYDFVNEPYTWDNGFGRGRNVVAFISSYLKGSLDPDMSTGINNRLTLRDMTVRMEDGKWFPYFGKDNKGKVVEVSVGALLSYANFPVVEISGMDIEAKGNGEVTLMEGDGCPRQKITGCRLYLDNWLDRTVGKWKRQREQGTNLNIRGDNKSALIEGNSFIKHGNDEALSFFATLSDNSTMVVHENVRVVRNTFTYLDADPVPGSAGEGTEDGWIRPMHINGVLITFNPGNDAENRDIKTVWKDVVFAENTLNLEGPVCSAVGMNVLPGDVCHNVSFERNRIFHKYIDTHQLPGNGILDGIGENENGASPYLYSNTFVFKTKKDRTDLAPGTKGAASGTGTEIKPTPVVYRGNYIRYTQKTYDQPEVNDLKFYWSYEHSCFAVHGGDIEILDNYIDSTGAVVIRHIPSDGIYGNPGNPVTLFHCLPCEVQGKYRVRISGNEAVKYGVTLSCRPQYSAVEIINGYTVRMENNTLSDGAPMVLYNVKNSDIAVVRNSFTGCSKETLIQVVYKVELQSDPSVKLSLIQNKIESQDKYAVSITGKLLEADMASGLQNVAPISDFCYMLNWLSGYSDMSIGENAAAQSNILYNLYTNKDGSINGDK